MPTRPRRFSLFVAALTAISLAASPARSADRFPLAGLAPREHGGLLVQIAGAPLPPMSPDSVRDGIMIFSPVLAGVRLLGKTAALARGVGYMATLYAAIGEDAEADRLFEEAETILAELGIAGRDLGWINNNHGLVRLHQDRNAEAAAFFRRAIAALSEEHSPELQEARAKVEQNLGAAYELLGDPDRSESHFSEALEILRRLGKENNPDFDVIRANLGELYGSIHDYAAARALLEPLAAGGRLYGPVKFAVLNNLGYVLYASNDTHAAEAVLNRALVLTSPLSQPRMLVHLNLAATYFAAGNFDRSEREGEEALRLAERLYGEESSYSASATGSLGTVALARGDLKEAERLLTQAVSILTRMKGAAAESVLASLFQELAIVAQRSGDRPRAVDLSGRALALEKKSLARILAFGSESQRLAYRSNAYPYDQLANLGEANLLAEAVLATKGAVIESLLVERAQVRRSRSAADRERLDRIHALKVELMEKTGQGEPHLDPLQRELQKEETSLARSLKLHASPAARASLASIQAVLRTDEVLVEIIQYLRYDGERKNVPCYGAVVIPQRGSPSWVSLGPADSIDPLVAGLLQRLEVGNRGMDAPSAAGDVVPTLRALNDRVWNPLEHALPANARRVTLSPDGAMQFIPWGALLDERERYLAERCQVAQVAAASDLLRSHPQVADKSLLALADGANDLPSAREEVRHLAATADANGWRTTVLMGDDALETALNRSPEPGILHFATHGVQFAADGPRSVEERLGRNPMYRGAILLGGGKRTLAAWKQGAALPAGDDGILTAEEIAGLDLGRTWLTVLSACRSGAGEASIGEGILGLRRGFALAGTENLLYSLWSIDDEATAHFMQAFYERLFKSGDPAVALNETQAEELRRWTELDHDIPAAVFRAGGFVVTR